jgi:hypothetical protein
MHKEFSQSLSSTRNLSEITQYIAIYLTYYGYMQYSYSCKSCQGTYMTNTKYSSIFWICYGLSTIWVAMLVGSFAAFAFQNPGFEATSSIEATLSVKLSYRRIYAVIIGTLAINYMLFARKRHLDKVFMFMSAWLWAAYIDDTLVMMKYVYVPDHWLPHFAMMLRPIMLIAISWMAFETHLRAEK